MGRVRERWGEVILQNFWNIGSDFGTFFEAKYLYNPIV